MKVQVYPIFVRLRGALLVICLVALFFPVTERKKSDEVDFWCTMHKDMDGATVISIPCKLEIDSVQAEWRERFSLK